MIILKFLSSLKLSWYSIDSQSPFLPFVIYFVSKWCGFLFEILIIFKQQAKVKEEKTYRKINCYLFWRRVWMLLVSDMPMPMPTTTTTASFYSMCEYIYYRVVCETQSSMQNISVEIMKPNKKNSSVFCVFLSIGWHLSVNAIIIYYSWKHERGKKYICGKPETFSTQNIFSASIKNSIWCIGSKTKKNNKWFSHEGNNEKHINREKLTWKHKTEVLHTSHRLDCITLHLWNAIRIPIGQCYTQSVKL